MRILKTLTSIIFLGLMLFSNSCKKDITESEPQIACAVAGYLLNSNFEPTILGAEILIDDKKIGSTTLSSAQNNVVLSGSGFISKGIHEIKFKITSQTVTSAVYETVGANAVTSQSRFTFTDFRTTLKTGESIKFTINVD